MPPLMRDKTLATTFIGEHGPIKYTYEDRIKCVLVGDGAVGKTSLVVSYTTNGYPTEYVPTAFDNYNVVVTVDNQPVRLQLCDTAGQDDFDSLRPLCYPNTDIFLLCFSVVSPTSFYNVADKWIPEIREHNRTTPIILVGTQCDLRTDVKVLIELSNYQEQPVNENDARKAAQRLGVAAYIECSALTQKNLKEVFDTAILVVLQRNSVVLKGSSSQQREKPSKGKRLLSPRSEGEKMMTTEKQQCVDAIPTVGIHCKSKHMQKKRGWKKLCCFS